MKAMTKSQKQQSHVLIGVGYLYTFVNRPYDGNGLGTHVRVLSINISFHNILTDCSLSCLNAHCEIKYWYCFDVSCPLMLEPVVGCSLKYLDLFVCNFFVHDLFFILLLFNHLLSKMW